MELQTTVQIPAPVFNISHATRLLLLGSCFAENIGDNLLRHKFPVDLNPCGILYNPLSIANALQLILDGTPLQPRHLLQANGRWVSLLHHGSFSAPTPEQCLAAINQRLAKAHRLLPAIHLLVITWGTAWVYKHLPTGTIVANCHKLPASDFHRFRLTVDDIVSRYQPLIHSLRKRNPDLPVLLTVSPIRHWKDGAHGNQLSKATLLLAVDALRQQCDNIHYFPSYEILMDELRDYRFYAPDMLHPSPTAIEYIWQRFADTYFTPPTRQLNLQIEHINKSIAHRPIDPASPNHQHFLRQLLASIDQLTARHPHLDFRTEQTTLRSLLAP